MFRKCSFLDIQNKLAKMQQTQPLKVLLKVTDNVTFK